MKTDARKLNPDEQREKRTIALRMREQDYTFKETANAVGVHERTVAKWADVAARMGLQTAIDGGGQRGSTLGQKRRLTASQGVLIQTLITDKVPEQLKMGFALWTRDAVCELIHERCGFLMPVRIVDEYLKRWGYTLQRPLKRAYQQNPKVVQRWLDEDYRLIARRAKDENAEIQWADETGVRSDNHGGRSFAPAGKIPVREVSGSRFSTNMMSSVTKRGKLRFMMYQETMTAQVLIRFLDRLVRGSEGKKIFLTLDNLHVHHSKKVAAWVEARTEQIEQFFLPAYAPELNPDEYLNGDLKHQLKTGRTSRTQAELNERVRSILRKIQRRPERVASYFRYPKISYAA